MEEGYGGAIIILIIAITGWISQKIKTKRELKAYKKDFEQTLFEETYKVSPAELVEMNRKLTNDLNPEALRALRDAYDGWLPRLAVYNTYSERVWFLEQYQKNVERYDLDEETVNMLYELRMAEYEALYEQQRKRKAFIDKRVKYDTYKETFQEIYGVSFDSVSEAQRKAMVDAIQWVDPDEYYQLPKK